MISIVSCALPESRRYFNRERHGRFDQTAAHPGPAPLERFGKAGIVIVTGRHPPSPRAWPANARRNRRLRRLRLIFCIQPASKHLPGTLTFQRVEMQKRYGIAKDEAERQIDAWLNTIH
jgi:hypothetical protein